MAAAPWLGDFSTTAIVVAEFGTYNSSGASVTRNVNGTVSVFESTSTVALSSTAITDNEDYRGVTGAHAIWVDLSLATPVIGRDYTILIANSSVDAATVSAPLATFSIRNRAHRPSSTGGVVVATNNDKTGYSLSQSFPSNFSLLSVSSSGTVTVGTNNDKTGYTASSVTDKTGYSIAVGGIGSSAIASTAAQFIADALLDRDMSVGTDSGSTSVRTVRQALRPLRNRFGFGAAGSTYQVYKEDDATLSWTSIVTQSSDAIPITGSDPLGP